MKRKKAGEQTIRLKLGKKIFLFKILNPITIEQLNRIWNFSEKKYT